ncbi:DUF4007 family protein [Leptolyngbya iicbica]|uniref:DUF4007 family protein n=2 Tax=Cyanophyceae TaxID=3028117 RepID=A0A4Q7E853_9CYAN|nr:DUF4007 family protein [Leptolyngbya sp. LK]RZM78643.1 DUF4007 family protein [Leptolyngbya sp. LK]
MAKPATLNIDEVKAPKVTVFARHETFHPRFGWLKKGFDRAAENPKIFLEDNAPVQLGVGKNMVRSIRYWCNAFELLEDDEPTEFGEALLSHSGWDPYLEDPASLWLLHWQLLQQPCYATAWDFTFNHFRKVEFTYEDLYYELCEYRDREATRIADSSIKKDVSCILRMYAGQNAKASMSEDALDCPFTDLRLIQAAGDKRHYAFRIGPKHNLPAEIIVYAALIFAEGTYQTARTIPIANLLYDNGSPGLIFKLNESALCDAIERVNHIFKELSIDDAAGKLQFTFMTDHPTELAKQVLASYYDNQQGDAR